MNKKLQNAVHYEYCRVSRERLIRIKAYHIDGLYKAGAAQISDEINRQPRSDDDHKDLGNR